MILAHMAPATFHFTGTTLLPEGVIVEQAQGCVLQGSDGTDYLDFTAGSGAALLGYNHPHLQSALQAQLAAGYPQPAGLFASPAWHTLAESLSAALPAHLNLAHPTSNGHSALHQALHLAREITGRPDIIAVYPETHDLGRVITVPFPVHETNEDDGATTLAAIQDLLETGTEAAAVVIPAGLSRAGGWALLPVDFPAVVQEVCRRYGMLMILDERETAGGRTGRVFARLEPAPTGSKLADMVVLGGPLMAGLPLGLLCLPEELAEYGLPGPAGGDALGAAAAAATLEALRAANLLAAAAERGGQLQAGLRALQHVYPFFARIRGEGLFVSVEIGVPGRGPDADLAQRIQETCLARGLILQVGGRRHNVIAWMPPLVVGETDIATALAYLDDALEEIFED